MHHIMKNLNLLFFIICLNTCLAQDVRLFEQDWYLHDLIMDGKSNVPPINSELSYVLLEFNQPNEFHTVVCSGTDGGALLTFNGTDEFTIQGGILWLAGACNIYENIMFTDLYESVFWDQAQLNTIEYNITESGQDRMLTITSSNGDQAIYGNNVLSITDFDIANLKIYPNPVIDNIHIDYIENNPIDNVKIYDLKGKLIKLEENEFSQIDVSYFKSGLYIISIENEKKKKFITRFLKR